MNGREGNPPKWIQIQAIAVNTFREGVRSRIFYILFAFAVAMILFSAVMGVLTIGSRSKIILDLGLTFISFFCVMTAIFVGIGLIYQEVEKKTIFLTVLTSTPRPAAISSPVVIRSNSLVNISTTTLPTSANGNILNIV